ncbi:MAG: Asp-tRNA(Asn)/Glu-tRNA(Gln) amidotransferase subunit GatA [Calditrichaeota bacterium]|nr:MAG: Asp-tRNA(Asn)/Glu-tRNA(Gln) amidotransferase subunit GatA [Calditrichota bacterium]
MSSYFFLEDNSVETTVKKYLKKIDENSHLNAFITVAENYALEQAKIVDEKIKNRTAGKLAGLVISLKDLICTKGIRTTAGSKILENFIPPYDASLVKNLKNEDAVIIGKNNLDEFAMGSSNETSAFGKVLHPLDNSLVPGGSSGGSAVSVAAGLSRVSLGSETGGSIRQPAAFCGVVGLKTTYGRVSRYGVTAFASSFDQVGPIGKTVEDVARVTEVISGFDKMDSTSAPNSVPDYTQFLNQDVKGLKMGVLKECFDEGVDPEIKKSVLETIELLRKNGAEIKEVSLPLLKYGIATYYILTTAEASANLARYDGIRYTYRNGEAKGLDEVYVKSRSEGFGTEVKRRIMLGTYVLSAGYYDAFYAKGQKVRTLMQKEMNETFAGLDCILAPTTPNLPFKAGEKLDDPLKMYLNDIFTVSANLTGIPSLSVPCGNAKNGLPIGIQIMAKSFDEGMTFRVGDFIEKNIKILA